MKISTSSWFTPLPPEILRVGISRGTPRGFPAGYRRLVQLNPADNVWAVRGRDITFADLYRQQLASLDARAIVEKLERLGDGRDVALVCWEPPTSTSAWCHRSLVAGWLFDSLGLQVDELGHEGCAAHPKLPHPRWFDSPISSIRSPR